LTEDRLGLLSMASGGTILVEGVAGMPLDLQGKLLRALGQGTFRRLGDEKETRADARFIFSTALDLDVEVKEGRFRSDLYHRIKVLCLKVPPLRERPEDLPELVDMFLREGTGHRPVLERGVIERLIELPWPGNVRELRNLIARLRVESPERISIESLEKARGGREDPSVFPRSLLHGQPLSRLKDRLERDYVLYHLSRLGGDTTALSRFLGLSRQQFYRRSRRLGIRLHGKGKA
jgi:two-component system nitrogen regulation response regulator NtrX